MQQSVQAILGALAALLVGLVVVGALAVLIVVEGYYLVGYGTRLYWRCKESMRQLRGEGGDSRRSQPDPAVPQPSRRSASRPRHVQPGRDGDQAAGRPEDRPSIEE
jgi:hypothetical protein